jgi:two-component system NtrC family response regulator
VESARAACNRGDAKAARRALEAARPGLAEPAIAQRWHMVRFMLLFYVEHQNEAALEELAQMLRGHRRSLDRPAAGTLWNDVALVRAALGDLAGAERALLHALHLLADCDGPLPLMAAQNLIEIRLRRGRLRGMVDWLGHALELDRRNRNQSGIVQDLELLARHELARGRLVAALDRLREALATLDWPRTDRYAPALHVLMARAWGWMGQRAEAAAAIERAGGGAALGTIEAEERPAVLALAGDREGALREASEGPFHPLWQAALSGQPAPLSCWQALEGLEEFRAGRLVLDLELTLPGLVPVAWQRRASAGLRRAGAGGLATRLESSDRAALRAIASHCRAVAGGPAPLAELFSASGYPEARLSLVRGGETTIVVAGPGGAEQIETPHDGGRAVLSAPFVDDALRALFALALRDVERHDPEGVAEGDQDLLGESPALRAALSRADRFARGSLPVLVLGESGSGKELVARRIHERGARAGREFVAVNCAATTETLLTSDLFGHARGAFTGADRERKGVFESAHGGTVFLDELGDLPLSAQGLLLRVLQEGEVRRLGESLPRRVDVRVIGATHRDLAAMARRGEFRQDLYYRLKVATVGLPPLRERGEDLLLLARRFLAAWRPGLRISPPAREALQRHDWPGNVRELRNVLEAAAALCDGDVLMPEHLDLPSVAAPRRGGAVYHLEVDALRRRLLEDALAATGGRRAEAARRLGLSRQALSYLMRQLGLGSR